MAQKLLLIRLDKIGDLVSTMCVDQVVDSQGRALNENYEIFWCIQKGLSFVPHHAEPLRQFIELDKNNASEAAKIFREFLQQHRFDAVVSFQAPWWIHFECWRAGIPLRSGVLSKWHSFLFLNKGLRQKRSESVQHEADYNRDLICHALNLPQQQTPFLRLKVSSSSSLLEKFSLSAQNYVVVHAGMAGSARNWSTENYIALITELKNKYVVVLTGTPADEEYLAPIKLHFAQEPRVLILQNKLSTMELLQILSTAKACVAPSTGVAHLAASLGIKTIGIYPPIRVQHPTRWAHRGPQAQVLVPRVNCPAQFKCLGSSCADFDCLKRITPLDVVELVG
ncbi:MAG: glycosyltransferase family 9 protein [Bdellovibrionia bacterium]